MIKEIEISRILPHPENSNRMDAETLSKLRRHIESTGRYEPLIVQPHPTEDDRFQVINGHHRLQVLKALGHTKVRCVIWEVDDDQTRLYLATLNRLSGEDIPERRALLIGSLLESFGVDDLAGLLPESQDQIAELQRLARVELDELMPRPTADIDFRQPRGLDKSLLLALADCRWIGHHDNCLIVGPTGAGKSYLACALGQQACRQGYSVRYLRLPRLLSELTIARGDGRYPRVLASLARVELIVLDDWGTAALAPEQCRELLEILEDRYQRRSTLVASQLPLPHWHEYLADPTLADAILDRLVHNAHTITLKGESMRKHNKALSADPKTGTTNNQ